MKIEIKHTLRLRLVKKSEMLDVYVDQFGIRWSYFSSFNEYSPSFGEQDKIKRLSIYKHAYLDSYGHLSIKPEHVKIVE